MSSEQIIFYFFAAMVLISALLVVSIHNLVRSIFLFFVTLFSLAALYVFAFADFVAITQVVIYVGGVLVLMLFAFMLSNKELLSKINPVKGIIRVNHIVAILVCTLFLFILLNVIIKADFESLLWIKTADQINGKDNTVHQIGIQTMTRYLLPFEVLSVLLLMALIGAAHLARKEKKV
jgi:NADH-quinone oxidoreductase subunit J